MKKVLALTVLMALLFGCAAAEQEVFLPNSRYVIDVPDWMDYSDAVDGDLGVDAYVSADLEMDYLSYSKEEEIARGMPDTLRETVKKQRQEGIDAELRKVNGIEMICFRTVDEEDGTPCIGYVFEDGDWLVEIDFWYSTQEAADMTKEIMETIRTAE